MSNLFESWQFWALMAAFFAALTAVFAKVGVTDINSNFATFLRTIVVLVALALLLWYAGQYESLNQIPPKAGVFLVLSGLATGASWLCYFKAMQLGKASQVAPVDKLSVVMVAIFAAMFLGEKMTAFGWSGIAMIFGGVLVVSLA